MVMPTGPIHCGGTPQSLKYFMPTCYLDDRPFPITLTETPMSREWLDRHAGKTLEVNTPYDDGTVNRLHQLITRHRPLFRSLRLTFLTDITTREELMHQSTLAAIHAGIVDLETRHRHTQITDILTRNTQGGWDDLHLLLHQLETQISTTIMTFSSTEPPAPWQWHQRFTLEQWRDSTSFDTTNITMPTTELGRTPYESFRYAPDHWHIEGGMTGLLEPRLQLKTRRARHRPDPGYEEWCDAQGIPVIGEHLPLANFTTDAYLAVIPTVTSLRIET